MYLASNIMAISNLDFPRYHARHVGNKSVKSTITFNNNVQKTAIFVIGLYYEEELFQLRHPSSFFCAAAGPAKKKKKRAHSPSSHWIFISVVSVG